MLLESLTIPLIIVTIFYILTDISQTKHTSAVKFRISYEKNKSFLLIPKSQKV